VRRATDSEGHPQVPRSKCEAGPRWARNQNRQEEILLYKAFLIPHLWDRASSWGLFSGHLLLQKCLPPSFLQGRLPLQQQQMWEAEAQVKRLVNGELG
jgi:hypothetical protein